MYTTPSRLHRVCLCLWVVLASGATACTSKIETPPSDCGNGTVNRGEQCDDGNQKGGDGCSRLCNQEQGFTCSGAPSRCLASQVCGDGVLLGGEECDDGNTADADGCSATCLQEQGWLCSGGPSQCVALEVVCGDGVRAGSERCDDGNTTEGDGCDTNCTPSGCGNGVRSPDEACEDGNQTSGDGCAPGCQVELGFTCPKVGACYAGVCGDGQVQGLEGCDDGNGDKGDGCSPDCLVEAGWSCPAGVPCYLGRCGNGTREGSEACDDGNNVDTDGCRNNCTFAPLLINTFNASSTNNLVGGFNDVARDSEEACGASASPPTTVSFTQQTQDSANGTPYGRFTFNVVRNDACGFEYGVVYSEVAPAFADMRRFTRIRFLARGSVGQGSGQVFVTLRGRRNDPCVMANYGTGVPNDIHFLFTRPTTWSAMTVEFSAFTELFPRCSFFTSPYGLAAVSEVHFLVNQQGQSGSLDLDDVMVE